MDDELIGTVEAATILGVRRQRVDQLMRTYDDFPAPRLVARRRIWSRAQIEVWALRHPNRPPGRRWPERGGGGSES